MVALNHDETCFKEFHGIKNYDLEGENYENSDHGYEHLEFNPLDEQYTKSSEDRKGEVKQNEVLHSREDKLPPAIIFFSEPTPKLKPAIIFLNDINEDHTKVINNLIGETTQKITPPVDEIGSVQTKTQSQQTEVHVSIPKSIEIYNGNKLENNETELIVRDGFGEITQSQTKVIGIGISSKKGVNLCAIAHKLREMVKFIIYENGLYFYDGSIYRLLDKPNALRLIMLYCREYALETGNPQTIKGIYDFLYMEPNIIRTNVDESKNILAFRNGYLNIQSGEFRPSTPDLFITSCLDLDYNADCNMNCPNFDQFLEQIAGGDQLLLARMWEVTGFYLTSDMSEKCFVLLQGVPDSGKSVFGRLFEKFYSKDATTSVDIRSLKTQFALAELIGKRLNLSMDLPAGILSADSVSIIKQLTGGDLLTADIKYMNRVRFRNTCKLLYSTNHTFELEYNDQAFFDRIVVIPFNYRVPKEHQNRKLDALFEQEKLAIVLKGLQYYKQLVARNYQFSGDYKVNENISFANIREPSKDEFVKEFVSRCCQLTSFEQGTFTRILYEAYANFVDEKNRYNVAGFSTSLHRQFREVIFKDKWRDVSNVNGNPENGYKGIILNEEGK